MVRFTYFYCQPGLGSSPSWHPAHFPSAHRNSPDAEVDSSQQTHSCPPQKPVCVSLLLCQGISPAQLCIFCSKQCWAFMPPGAALPQCAGHTLPIPTSGKMILRCVPHGISEGPQCNGAHCPPWKSAHYHTLCGFPPFPDSPSTLLHLIFTESPPKSTMRTKTQAGVAFKGNYPKTIFKCVLLWGHPNNSYTLWEWLTRIGRISESTSQSENSAEKTDGNESDNCSQIGGEMCSKKRKNWQISPQG